MKTADFRFIRLIKIKTPKCNSLKKAADFKVKCGTLNIKSANFIIFLANSVSKSANLILKSANFMIFPAAFFIKFAAFKAKLADFIKFPANFKTKLAGNFWFLPNNDLIKEDF